MNRAWRVVLFLAISAVMVGTLGVLMITARNSRKSLPVHTSSPEVAIHRKDARPNEKERKKPKPAIKPEVTDKEKEACTNMERYLFVKCDSISKFPSLLADYQKIMNRISVFPLEQLAPPYDTQNFMQRLRSYRRWFSDQHSRINTCLQAMGPMQGFRCPVVDVETLSSVSYSLRGFANSKLPPIDATLQQLENSAEKSVKYSDASLFERSLLSKLRSQLVECEASHISHVPPPKYVWRYGLSGPGVVTYGWRRMGLQETLNLACWVYIFKPMGFGIHSNKRFALLYKNLRSGQSLSESALAVIHRRPREAVRTNDFEALDELANRLSTEHLHRLVKGKYGDFTFGVFDFGSPDQAKLQWSLATQTYVNVEKLSSKRALVPRIWWQSKRAGSINTYAYGGPVGNLIIIADPQRNLWEPGSGSSFSRIVQFDVPRQ